MVWKVHVIHVVAGALHAGDHVEISNLQKDTNFNGLLAMVVQPNAQDAVVRFPSLPSLGDLRIDQRNIKPVDYDHHFIIGERVQHAEVEGTVIGLQGSRYHVRFDGDDGPTFSLHGGELRRSGSVPPGAIALRKRFWQPSSLATQQTAFAAYDLSSRYPIGESLVVQDAKSPLHGEQGVVLGVQPLPKDTVVLNFKDRQRVEKFQPGSLTSPSIKLQSTTSTRANRTYARYFNQSSTDHRIYDDEFHSGFRPGDVVEIHGLSSGDAHFNGLAAFVAGYDTPRKVFLNIPDIDFPKSFDVDNVRPLDLNRSEEEIVAAPEQQQPRQQQRVFKTMFQPGDIVQLLMEDSAMALYSGQEAQVLQQVGDDRLKVSIPDFGEAAVPSSQLRYFSHSKEEVLQPQHIAAGDRIEVHSLDEDKSYNGKQGVVQASTTEEGEKLVVVDFGADAGLMKVPLSNVKPATKAISLLQNAPRQRANLAQRRMPMGNDLISYQ